MSDIRLAIEMQDPTTRTIGRMLLAYYEFEKYVVRNIATSSALTVNSEKTGKLEEILDDYLKHMKELESDKDWGGKQATLIVMTMADIKDLISDEAPQATP